jgi:hypothetical protein
MSGMNHVSIYNPSNYHFATGNVACASAKGSLTPQTLILVTNYYYNYISSGDAAIAGDAAFWAWWT